MTTRKRILMVPVLVLALMAAACTDNALQTTAKGLGVIGAAIGTLQTTVIAGNRAGSISDEDTEKILIICRQVAAAGKQATALTQNLTTLPPSQQGQVLSVIKPVLDSINSAVANGTAGIKNQNTKAEVLAGLTTIQVALVSIQAAVGGK